MEADESRSGSGDSDCAIQCGDKSENADDDGRNVKFGQGKKRPRRSQLEIIAPQT